MDHAYVADLGQRTASDHTVVAATEAEPGQVDCWLGVLGQPDPTAVMQDSEG